MNKIEILRPGKFKAMNGTEVSFSVEILKDIALNYDPKIYQSPLVIGHPKVEDPAYGWVKSLSFSGDKLVAEPEAVVEEFANLVSTRRYQNVSASLFPPNHPANPKPGKYYLKHIGFLGAVPPAVTGLKPVSFAADDQTLDFSAELVIENKANPEPSSEHKVLSSKINEFAAKETALQARELAISKRERELSVLELSAFISDLIKEGKVQSEKKDDLVCFMQSISSIAPISFASTKQESPLNFFKDFLKNQPSLVELGEYAPSSRPIPQPVTDPTKFAEQIIAFCSSKAKEGITVSFSEAAERILRGEK